MDTNQTLKVLNKYFNTIDIFGSYDNESFITLLYLMFIDEYYEFHRDISLKDLDNDEIGLTDCLVKKLNSAIECLKNNSILLKGEVLDYLPGKLHWIIPDVPEDTDTDYIDNNILYTSDSIQNHILLTQKSIINKILEL